MMLEQIPAQRAAVDCTYTRLQKRIAEGGDVARFEQLLATLPYPKELAALDALEKRLRELADRIAFAELVAECRARNDIAGLCELLEIAFDDLTAQMQREREQQRIADELEQSLRPMLENVLA